MTTVPALSTGAITVTTERDVERETAEQLWELYTTSFDDLQDRAAARQLLSRPDFDLEVLDPRVTKYIARQPDRSVAGLCTLTNELATVPWISPGFYQARYPAHFELGLIFYCGLAMVHPTARSTRAFALMVSAFGRDIGACDGILAADMCHYNIDTVELARTITLMMRRVWGGAELVELDRQTYLAWEPPPGSTRRG
jgi:hypothetical protein